MAKSQQYYYNFIRDFFSKYGAQIYDTGKTIQRYSSYPKHFEYNNSKNYFMDVYQEKIIAIELPENALNDLSHILELYTKDNYDEQLRKEHYSRLAQDYDEQKLREDNAAVQAAWEYYQVAKTLARNKK